MAHSPPSYQMSHRRSSSRMERDDGKSFRGGVTALGVGGNKAWAFAKGFLRRAKPKRRRPSSPSTYHNDKFTTKAATSASIIEVDSISPPSSAWRRKSTSSTKKVPDLPWGRERWGDSRFSASSDKLLPPSPLDLLTGRAGRPPITAHKKELVRGRTRTQSSADTLPPYEEHYKSTSLGQSLSKNTESGIDLREDNGGSREEPTIPVIRKDPFDALPPEITSVILSYLDAATLASTERVSSKWAKTAKQRHAWRQAFQNETWLAIQNAPISNSKPLTRGLGLGKQLPDQNWKTMLKARRELQSRWRKGEAAAIYLEGHTDSVYCVQFDEEKIVTGSRDQTVRVWDAKTYGCIRMLGIPNRTSVNSRPSLRREVLGRPGRPTAVLTPGVTIMRYSVPPAEFRHTGSILCLQFDENIMVTGSSDRTCIIWDLQADYKPLRRLRSHNAGVLDICFDDKHIISCSKDTSICLWDRKTGERLRRMTGHRGPVNAVQLRGNLIVSASGDGVAKLWNLTSGLCIKEFASKDRGMACVDFSLDSRTILAGGNDQVVYQFDTSSGELTRELKGHQGLVRSLHLDNTNGRIISGSYDRTVRAYDLATGELIAAFVTWTTSWILSAKADYRHIVAASQDSRAVVMDFGHGVPGIELLTSG